jgi:hypothetical protein
MVDQGRYKESFVLMKAYKEEAYYRLGHLTFIHNRAHFVLRAAGAASLIDRKVKDTLLKSSERSI